MNQSFWHRYTKTHTHCPSSSLCLVSVPPLSFATPRSFSLFIWRSLSSAPLPLRLSFATHPAYLRFFCVSLSSSRCRLICRSLLSSSSNLLRLLSRSSCIILLRCLSRSSSFCLTRLSSSSQLDPWSSVFKIRIRLASHFSLTTWSSARHLHHACETPQLFPLPLYCLVQLLYHFHGPVNGILNHVARPLDQSHQRLN